MCGSHFLYDRAEPTPLSVGSSPPPPHITGSHPSPSIREILTITLLGYLFMKRIWGTFICINLYKHVYIFKRIYINIYHMVVNVLPSLLYVFPHKVT